MVTTTTRRTSNSEKRSRLSGGSSSSTTTTSSTSSSSSKSSPSQQEILNSINMGSASIGTQTSSGNSLQLNSNIRPASLSGGSSLTLNKDITLDNARVAVEESKLRTNVSSSRSGGGSSSSSKGLSTNPEAVASAIATLPKPEAVASAIATLPKPEASNIVRSKEFKTASFIAERATAINEFNKAGLKRVGQQFEVIGKKTANVFLPKSKEFYINNANASYLDRTLSSPLFIFGAPAVVAAGSALGAGGAIRAGATAVKGSRPIQTALALEQTNRLTFVTGTAIRVTAGGAALKTGGDLIAKSRLTGEQRAAIANANLNAAIGAGFQGQADAANAKTSFNIPFTERGVSLQGFANELSPFFGSKSEFEKAARANLEAQGLSGNALDRATEAALSRRTARGYTELGSQLLVGAGAERIGRFGISKAFSTGGVVAAKSSFGKIAVRTIPSLGIAGFFEGFGGSQVQQSIREEQRNFRNSIKAGAFGSASAIALGTPIAGFALSRPAASKGINIFANILDPTEYPSDKLADLFAFGERSIFKQSTSVPTFTPVPNSNNKAFQFSTEVRQKGGQRTITGGRNEGARFSKGGLIPQLFTKRVQVPSDLPDITLSASQAREAGKVLVPPPLVVDFSPSGKTPSGGKTPAQVPRVTIPSLDSIIGSPVPSQRGGGKVSNIVPIPINTDTETNTNTFIPSFTPTDTPTNQQTITNTFSTAVSIGVPVVSSVVKIPPPFIPPFGFDTGGSGSNRKLKNSKFINELEQAFKVAGINQAKTTPLMSTPKKAKAKPKTTSKAKSPFEIADEQFLRLAKSTAKKRRGFFI